MEKLLTPQEIAEVLGVAVSTIYQWTHQEYIPHVKIGRLIRFKRSKVEKWVEKKETGGRLNKSVSMPF